jgi:hypothetical protein
MEKVAVYKFTMEFIVHDSRDGAVEVIEQCIEDMGGVHRDQLVEVMTNDQYQIALQAIKDLIEEFDVDVEDEAEKQGLINEGIGALFTAGHYDIQRSTIAAIIDDILTDIELKSDRVVEG